MRLDESEFVRLVAFPGLCSALTLSFVALSTPEPG